MEVCLGLSCCATFWTNLIFWALNMLKRCSVCWRYGNLARTQRLSDWRSCFILQECRSCVLSVRPAGGRRPWLQRLDWKSPRKHLIFQLKLDYDITGTMTAPVCVWSNSSVFADAGIQATSTGKFWFWFCWSTHLSLSLCVSHTHTCVLCLSSHLFVRQIKIQHPMKLPQVSHNLSHRFSCEYSQYPEPWISSFIQTFRCSLLSHCWCSSNERTYMRTFKASLL